MLGLAKFHVQSHNETNGYTSQVATPHDPSSVVLQPKQTAPAVDLTSVLYEMRDSIPGVKCTKNRSEAWTPVVNRKQMSGHASDDSSSITSGSELDESCSRMMQYSARKRFLGVSIH